MPETLEDCRCINFVDKEALKMAIYNSMAYYDARIESIHEIDKIMESTPETKETSKKMIEIYKKRKVADNELLQKVIQTFTC